MSNFPSRKKWAMAGSKVSGHSASGAESADMEDADGSGMCGSAETQRGPESCHDATSYPGVESLRRSYPGDEDVGILKKPQGGGVKISVAEEVGHGRGKVSGHSASGAEKCDMRERRVSLSTNAETAAHGGAPPTTRKEDEHVSPAPDSRTCTEQSSFERRVRRRAEQFGPEETERGNAVEATAAVLRDVERSDDDEPRRSSSSRVHRVADFAKWATRVAEEAAVDAASDSSSVD